jgi:hypothetical protein
MFKDQRVVILSRLVANNRRIGAVRGNELVFSNIGAIGKPLGPELVAAGLILLKCIGAARRAIKIPVIVLIQ